MLKRNSDSYKIILSFRSDPFLFIRVIGILTLSTNIIFLPLKASKDIKLKKNCGVAIASFINNLSNRLTGG